MHRSAPIGLFGFAALLFSLSGCATGPSVVSAGPQTFSISTEDTLQWNARTVSARQLAFEKANGYCAKRKLVMVPVSLDVRPGEIGVKPGTADLVFRALPPGDPAIKRSQAVFRQYDPMVVRETVVGFDANGVERPVSTPHRTE